jgi:NADH-quinone oxidoreductase subunit H
MTFLNDPIAFISDWLSKLLESLNLPDGFDVVISNLFNSLIIAVFSLVVLIVLIWVERKISGRFQDRLGPNRAGPYGLLQTFADVTKLLIKETILPEGADSVPYNIAPILSFASVILIWVVIPFSPVWFGVDLNVGVLYITAVGSFGVLAVLMAGWSSNNKYSLLGAFRSVAQMVSYEVPLLLTMLIPVLLARTMSVNGIVEAQSIWYVVIAPVPALIFFLSSVAEIGRSPFDLLEADSEIVAGYITEYSGMKFAMFFAGEYLHAFVIGIISALLFFGGWRGPGAETYPLLGFFYLMLKAFAVYFIVLWLRNSLPRLRIDHLLSLNWKVLTPLSLVMVVITAILDKSFESSVWHMPSLLGANILVLVLTGALLQRVSKRYRNRERITFDPRPLAVPPPTADTEEASP